MTRRRASLAVAALVGLGSACSSTDSTMPKSLAAPDAASLNESEGRGVFQRYTAIGTSISMGVQSDGVNFMTQVTSWPAQLAALGHRALEQPLIALPGCPAPIAAPLILNARISGEPAVGGTSPLNCSPLLPGIQLPVDNVAINGAFTSDALFTTPEATSNPIYSRVLQPRHTQVSTMLENNPKLVSVELGVNEVLGARSGIAIPGVTLVPLNVWAPLYNQVLDSVQSTTKMAVLVGLPNDIRNFPSLRTGNELWADRAEFASKNIAVSPDCNGSTNEIFVSLKVGPVLIAALQAAAHNLGPVPFSCAAGGNTDPDLVLTTNEVAVVNGLIAQMNAHIQSEAAKRGFAYFSLGALYDLPTLKPAFSLNTIFFSTSPFGSLISNDGVHPSAAGAAVIAAAAAKAINDKYSLGIPVLQ